MVGEDNVQRAARFLHEAHQSKAQYEPLPEDISPRDISEAYDIQEAFHELLFQSADLSSVIKWRLRLQ